MARITETPKQETAFPRASSVTQKGSQNKTLTSFVEPRRFEHGGDTTILHV